MVRDSVGNIVSGNDSVLIILSILLQHFGELKGPVFNKPPPPPPPPLPSSYKMVAKNMCTEGSMGGVGVAQQREWI